MEKYNAETMAIVPHKPTLQMLEYSDQPDVIDISDAYCLMVDSAPKVEPVVPLSEVLELLESKRYDAIAKNQFAGAAYLQANIDLIKQKYGVSE